MRDEERTPPTQEAGAPAEAGAEDLALAEVLRAQLTRPTAPPSLRARVEAALAAEVDALGRQRGRVAPRPGLTALAAGLGALLVAGAAAGLWAAYPVGARRLATEAVKGAAVSHRRLEARGPARPADGPEEVSAWLSDALGVPVRLAGPGAAGVRLAGTAPTSLLGEPGVAVFLEVDGRSVTLSLVRAPWRLPAEGRVRLGRGRPMVAAHGDVRIILWRQGRLFCTLAARLSEPRLTALFRTLRPGIEVGG